MDRDRKNKQTRQKILDAALAEFGSKSYGEASLNTICASGAISKGIIYHYFRDKEELYLQCVRDCFDALTHHLTGAVTPEQTPAQALEAYFDARVAFFGANPLYLGMFCSARMRPPAHLTAAVSQAAQALDDLNLAVLTGLLKSVRLQPGITIEATAELLREYQDFVNTRNQLLEPGVQALSEHERRCRRSLQILLYGVIARDGE